MNNVFFLNIFIIYIIIEKKNYYQIIFLFLIKANKQYYKICKYKIFAKSINEKLKVLL